MAENERQKLRRYIRIIQAWSEDRVIEKVEGTFYNLATLDQNRNEDLWEELGEALQENEALHREEALWYLRDDAFAARGYWWFDPENWAASRALKGKSVTRS